MFKSKLAIAGGSNGGLLVGAVMTQRPELYGATLPAVGVMDMLRYHKFTIGRAWSHDYGLSDDPEHPEQFEALYAYSPYHNTQSKKPYPPTLITTADHDDRVFPAHSFKFGAALQAAQIGNEPILMRIETKAGHGAGKPTSKYLHPKKTLSNTWLAVAMDGLTLKRLSRGFMKVARRHSSQNRLTQIMMPLLAAQSGMLPWWSGFLI